MRVPRQTAGSGTPEAPEHQITESLRSLRRGDSGAEDDLIAMVYGRLRRIAGHLMVQERPGHTLQATALVHEAFLRLRGQLDSFENRRHLFRAAREAMRRLLIDHARKRNARKRRGEPGDLRTGVAQIAFDPWLTRLALALEDLGRLSTRQRDVVEYRYLIGLTVEETARHLGVSRSTIEKDWRLARAWLYERLGAPE